VLATINNRLQNKQLQLLNHLISFLTAGARFAGFEIYIKNMAYGCKDAPRQNMEVQLWAW
jgi:hypothetical protein